MHFRFDQTVITINQPDRATLLATVRDRLSRDLGFALATINLDHVVKLGTSAAYRTAYAQHDLVVADGNPIVWLSRLAGKPVSLVPGSDMVVPLCTLMADMGLPVSLVGTTDDALAKAAVSLRAQVPGLRIGAMISPRFGFDPVGAEAGEIMAQVAALGPGLCLLALSAPKQEMLAAFGRHASPHTGFAGFGAGLDFLAGHQQRAPAWMRAVALEWVWRAVTSPRRMIPRYAACAAVLPQQALAALRLRFG